jgi:hypothetical protein
MDEHKTSKQGINKLIEWSQKWLSSNPAKCKIMSISNKTDKEYEMKLDGKLWQLEKFTEERNLGVCTGSDLKPGIQYKTAASKAMSLPE